MLLYISIDLQANCYDILFTNLNQNINRECKCSSFRDLKLEEDCIYLLCFTQILQRKPGYTDVTILLYTVVSKNFQQLNTVPSPQLILDLKSILYAQERMIQWKTLLLTMTIDVTSSKRFASRLMDEYTQSKLLFVCKERFETLPIQTETYCSVHNAQ